MGSKIHEAEIHNGVYVLDGVPPGEVTITVVRLDPGQPDPNDALNKARATMIARKAADPRDIDPAVVTDPAQLEVLQRKRHLLPFAYSSPNTSDLHFKVTPGSNTFNITLQDRPDAK